MTNDSRLTQSAEYVLATNYGSTSSARKYHRADCPYAKRAIGLEPVQEIPADGVRCKQCLLAQIDSPGAQS